MNNEQRHRMITQTLNQHNQEHLLAFYSQLNDQQKQSLLDEVDNLDFAEIPKWIAKYVKGNNSAEMPSDLAPPQSYPTKPTSQKQCEKYDHVRKLGAKLISGGKVAAFVVAGGQGTRLGFDGPKGDFPISSIKHKTLFQIFAEQILAVSRKYGVNLPWYVMTSPLNHSATVEIFESSGCFGMDKSDIFIFQQGTYPNFDFDGKILLTGKSQIAASPNGHGGSLKAIYDSGALEDMKKRGVEFISYFQVDNPLINIFDPMFIGLHADDKAEMSSKALIKAGPMEKVGNFCLADGKVMVIEYSDLPDELAQKQNPDGSLVFELGSIAIHIISTSFVEKLNTDGFALPIHRAVKKIPHIDANGNSVNPQEPNGIKLETFVFDALPLAEKSIVLQTIRSEEFAPVKNAVGADSPEVTQKMMTARAAAWLKDAGVSIPEKADGSPDCVIEMAAEFAVSKEDVAEKLGQVPNIKPGDQIYLQ